MATVSKIPDKVGDDALTLGITYSWVFVVTKNGAVLPLTGYTINLNLTGHNGRTDVVKTEADTDWIDSTNVAAGSFTITLEDIPSGLDLADGRYTMEVSVESGSTRVGVWQGEIEFRVPAAGLFAAI